MKYERNEQPYLAIKEMSPQDRPREKMREKGAVALSDLELLMILLGAGSKERRVTEIATDLLYLLDSKPEPTIYDISDIKGIGYAKGTLISAALELGRRRIGRNGRLITTPKDIYNEVRHFSTREQEQFIEVYLNGAHVDYNLYSATVGLVNRPQIHPREVFAEPIAKRASAIAIAHNHPYGELIPSEADIATTGRLIQSGNLLGIKLIDHIIFNDSQYYSFIEHGLL